MHVLHVASEVYPFSRTGGLADVMGALPPALSGLGMQVSVLSPWYGNLKGEPKLVWEEGGLRLGEVVAGGVRYLFLQTPDFLREGIYHSDDVWRFSHWTRSILYALDGAGIDFDLLHGHDWVAGLAIAHATLRQKPSIFTIHNLQYQGRWGGAEAMPWTGLPWEMYTHLGLEYNDCLNPMKAGLIYSKFTTTVSPTYAREIATAQYGEGLEGVLQELEAQGRVVGIINGLDQERWNPRTDSDIIPFGDYAGKQANIEALRNEFGLDDAPILACVSRLVEQKGMDLLLGALPELLKSWNVVLLGSGDPALEAAFHGWTHHSRFRHITGMHEALSHRLYAGSHGFLMPSRFEPCGLSQMIALRYGSLPIARATGGLVDTVPSDTGFLFEEASPWALSGTAQWAHATLQHEDVWQSRVANGMALDFSWAASAQQYVALYERALR